jgi:hypothetical protein
MFKFEVVYYNDIYSDIPLTLGKKYVAFARHDYSTTWHVVNDYGHVMSFNSKIFVKIEDYRELQLQKLEL